MPTDQELREYFGIFEPTDDTYTQFRSKWAVDIIFTQPTAGILQAFKDGQLIMQGPTLFVNEAWSNYVNFIAGSN